ncbi:hypothetical protein LTR84_004995 [Exophiala bonariae]|uniref:Uncharacterized protein n=1 Tax=Exophiala bonariae TaxID=1690606 RepID=A0AAV9NNW4_9EURO|nr:hypothetical protein LTR84_004995 [Exophiala bonariae]
MTPRTVAQRDGKSTDQLDRLSTSPTRERSQVNSDLAAKPKKNDDRVSDDVRFVVWYHCRTSLKFDAIALWYNATYPQANLSMDGVQAKAIFEKVKGGWDNKKRDFEHDRVPLPLDQGWHLCDHHMSCSNKLYQDRKTLMRNPKTRVAGIALMKEMVTTIWDGTWEELLQCPRDHENIQGGEFQNPTARSHHPDNVDQPIQDIQNNLKSRSPAHEHTRENTDNNQGGNTEGISGGHIAENGPDSWNDLTHHPFRYAVRWLGGPTVLLLFMNWFLKSLFILWLITDPLALPSPAANLQKFSPSWQEMSLMSYGGLSMLDDIQGWLVRETRMFRGIDEAPELSIIEGCTLAVAGMSAATGFAVWQDWRFKDTILEMSKIFRHHHSSPGANLTSS